jgi:glycosyltransferase involved in cell wall biosynthesis
MPQISVLIPIFNVEKYLRECLDSVVNQTFRDLEIICINDGSTDGSLAIIEEYARRDPRIVIIDKANSGYGDSMNHGLDRATGEYIAIVESDDWVELDMFEELHDLATEHGVEVVKSNYFTYYADPERKALSDEKIELVRAHEVGRVIDPSKNIDIFFQQPAIWSAIYRRDFLVANGIRFLPTPGASYQDTSFAFKVWSSAHRVVYTSDAFLHYRRDNEASSVNNAGKVFCVSDEYAEIERFAAERDLSTEIWRILRLSKWGAYAWNIDRLQADLAPDFIALASEQFKADLESGRFNFEFCDVNQAREISEIIERPERVIERKQAQDAAKVSVVMPFFNVEEYLRKCIDSVLGQTLSEVELILVDDGSVDASSDIAEEYFRNDPRVRLVSLRNSGQAIARNRGMELAHADYIAFIDGDDYYEPDSLEKMRDALVEHDVDFVVGSIRPVFEPGIRSAMEKFQDQHYYEVRRSGLQRVTSELLLDLDASVCNKMFVRESVENRGIEFPEGLRFEDAYFVNAYGFTSSTAFFLEPEDYVYNYVRRAGSTMSTTFGRSNTAKDHLTVAFRLFELLEKHELTEKYGVYYMRMLDQYATFAFQHSEERDHAEIWRKLRYFVDTHREQLAQMDAYALRNLEHRVYRGVLGRLNKTPGLRRIVFRAGRTVQNSLAGIMPKLSVTHRARQNIHADITLLRQQVAGSTAALSAQLNSQRRRIAEIADQVDQLVGDCQKADRAKSTKGASKK